MTSTRSRLPPASATADALGVIPRLGQNAGGLDQHPQDAKRGRNPDREFRFEPETFGAEAMPLLDAALGIAAVTAHVPFADGAGRARHRIGSAHDADHEVSGRHAASRWCRLDPAERFVPEHQPWLTGRRKPIGSGQDFPIRAAHSQRHRANQNCAVRRRRLRHVVEASRIGDAGDTVIARIGTKEVTIKGGLRWY